MCNTWLCCNQGKEIASDITTLPPGSVVFEDFATEIIKGQVLKPLDRGPSARLQSDPLPGRIRYRAPDYSEVEIPFGDKDQKRDFTLKYVSFLFKIIIGFFCVSDYFSLVN